MGTFVALLVTGNLKFSLHIFEQKIYLYIYSISAKEPEKLFSVNIIKT